VAMTFTFTLALKLHPAIENLTFVLCHAENMNYWSQNLHGNLPDGDEDSTQMANVSSENTNRALSKEDELFLNLARLCLGLPLQHIANLFNISIATVSIATAM